MSCREQSINSQKALIENQYAIYGGAVGGMNSATYVQFAQKKVGCADVLGKYGVMLDAGGLATPAEVVDHGGELCVLLSHCHSDHCSGLPALTAARALMGGTTRVVVPGDSDPELRLERILELNEALDDPHMQRRNVPHTCIQRVPNRLTSRAASPICGPAGRLIMPFLTTHVVPSSGYSLVSVKQKLRKEFMLDADGEPLSSASLGLRVKELKSRVSPSQLFEEVQTVELAYTGDTTIGWLNHSGPAQTALQAQVLITEATFIDDSISPAQAAERGHCHIDSIAAHADHFENVGHLILTHFSRRYSKRQISDALGRLPEPLRRKTSCLVLEAYHA